MAPMYKNGVAILSIWQDIKNPKTVKKNMVDLYKLKQSNLKKANLGMKFDVENFNDLPFLLTYLSFFLLINLSTLYIFPDFFRGTPSYKTTELNLSSCE